MRGRAVGALISGALVLLASGWANAQCTKDIDCKGDRVCEAGRCTSPAAVTPRSATTGAALEPTPVGGDAEAEGQPPTSSPVGPGPSTEPTPGAALPPSLVLTPAPANETPAGATAPLGDDEPQTRRRNRGAMLTGIVMVSVGPVALLGALAAKNAQEKCDDALERDYPDHRLPKSERYRVDECEAYTAPLYVLGIGGALLSVAGIPLIIYGAKSVPTHPASASLRLLPWAGPGTSGVKLRLEL